MDALNGVLKSNGFIFRLRAKFGRPGADSLADCCWLFAAFRKLW